MGRAVLFLRRVMLIVHSGQSVAESNTGMAKSFAAMGSDGDGKPSTFAPALLHFRPTSSATPYTASRWAQTNLRMLMLYAPQLTAGIEGLILAKHIGVINSGSACPIHPRGLAEHGAYQPPSCLGIEAQPASSLQIQQQQILPGSSSRARGRGSK